MGKIIGFYAMPHPPIIIPEIGRGEEKKIDKTAHACNNIAIEISKLNPNTIIIITPHGPLFKDAVSLTVVPTIFGDLGKFNTPEVNFSCIIDEKLTSKIVDCSEESGITAVEITSDSASKYGIQCEIDHGTMIPLYFVNKMYTEYKLVHITYGLLSKIQLYKFGMAIKNAVEESPTNAVLIASGDLSHKLSNEGPYGYDPAGETFDREITKLLEQGNTRAIFNMDKNSIEAAGECGMRSYYIMLGAMDKGNIKGELLSYEAPFGVGYGVMRFDVKDNSIPSLLHEFEVNRDNQIKERRKNESPYVSLARKSLEHYIKYGEYINLPSNTLEELLKNKHGVFVSIKKEGELRGCIGTIFPTTNNCAEEIVRNAVEAGENDPRFYPVQEEELDDLVYSVDVLMSPEEAKKEDLDPKKFGVIVRNGKRTGLLLPDLEGVNSVDEQLEIALSKAGISKNEPFTIEKFEVIRYK